jgi:anti-sigma B factor antagonist
MKIHQRQKEGVSIFELSGELDFHTSPKFRDLLQEVIAKQVHFIVVNLKKVDYIDSSGLATFVEALQKIKRSNGKLVLAELAPAVRSVLEIAKLDSVFTLVGSEEEALELATPSR